MLGYSNPGDQDAYIKRQMDQLSVEKTDLNDSTVHQTYVSRIHVRLPCATDAILDGSQMHDGNTGDL